MKGQVGDRTRPPGAGLGLLSQMGAGRASLCLSCTCSRQRHSVLPGHIGSMVGWLPRPAPCPRHCRRGRQWGSQTSARPGSQPRPVKGDSEAGTDSWATGGPHRWPPACLLGHAGRGLATFCGPSPGSPEDPASFLARSWCSGDLRRVPAFPCLRRRSQQAGVPPHGETRCEHMAPRPRPAVFTRPPDHSDICQVSPIFFFKPTFKKSFSQQC